MKSKSGFTLIELLVVIAIIAILAAILFPVFAQAREKARMVSCLSNTKQIGLGIMQYVQDYDETYPTNCWEGRPIGITGTAWPADGVTAVTWAIEVLPYIKNTQIFTCPSDPNPKDGWSGYSPTPDCWGIPFPMSYGHNQMIFGYGGKGSNGACFGEYPDWAAPGLAMAAVPSPASTYMVADYGREFMETWWINNLRAANFTRVYNQSAPGGGRTKDGDDSDGANHWASRFKDSAMRHQGGQNVTFADGHSKYRKGTQIESGEDWMDLHHSTEGLFVRDY